MADKRLCCLVNPSNYCEGCKIIMCEACTLVHKGVAGKCIKNHHSDVFSLESMREYGLELEEIEDHHKMIAESEDDTLG